MGSNWFSFRKIIAKMLIQYFMSYVKHKIKTSTGLEQAKSMREKVTPFSLRTSLSLQRKKKNTWKTQLMWQKINLNSILSSSKTCLIYSCTFPSQKWAMQTLHKLLPLLAGQHKHFWSAFTNRKANSSPKLMVGRLVLLLTKRATQEGTSPCLGTQTLPHCILNKPCFPPSFIQSFRSLAARCSTPQLLL